MCLHRCVCVCSPDVSTHVCVFADRGAASWVPCLTQGLGVSGVSALCPVCPSGFHCVLLLPLLYSCYLPESPKCSSYRV